MATLQVPAYVPAPSEDAEQLRHAFEGWGTNEQLIIDILAHRNAAQRNLIRKTYHEAYGKDLLRSLDEELTSDFERAVVLFTLDPVERDAHLVNQSTKRFTSSNWVIMEIACTRSSLQLFNVRKAYHALYNKSLEEDVGDYRKLLVPLVSAFRYEGDEQEVNMSLAKAEAKILRDKISDKEYSDEEVIRIVTTRSKAQLNATLNHYNTAFGNFFNKDLKADADDEFLKLLRAAIKCLTVPEKYFEKVLRQAINKVGTDEWALTRVVTTRAEVDMVRIKERTVRLSRKQLPEILLETMRKCFLL
ncbi:hypothetical protein GQ457_06G043450 [Hibiscus cannabinus]